MNTHGAAGAARILTTFPVANFRFENTYQARSKELVHDEDARFAVTGAVKFVTPEEFRAACGRRPTVSSPLAQSRVAIRRQYEVTGSAGRFVRWFDRVSLADGSARGSYSETMDAVRRLVFPRTV